MSESLNSVLEQTYSNVEIIVVRPVSTDDSSFTDVLNHYADKVIYCETENTGCGLMMNEALKIATGEFVARLDEGDIFLPEKIELQVKMLEENSDVGLTITAHYLIGEDGSIQNLQRIPDFPREGVLLMLLHGYRFGNSIAMLRRECYCRVGLYSDILPTEYDMWLRLARHYKVGVINKPLVKQRIGFLAPSEAGEASAGIFGSIEPKIHQKSPPADKQFRDCVRQTISEATTSIPLEELFPFLQSHADNTFARACAYAARGAILMRHRLYESAEDDFTKPDASIHQMWLGIFSRRVKDYQAAISHFSKIPQLDSFYLDAQWAILLTEKAQEALPEEKMRLQAELVSEYNKMLRITLDCANGKSLDTIVVSDELIEEIQLYLGWDIPQVVDALYSGTKMLADEWNYKNPQSPEEIIDFYKEAENYIFDLAGWHRIPNRKQLTATAIKICQQNNLQKILEFGCGIGQDGILFAESGFEVTLADLPGKTLDFAKWRVKRRGTEIKFTNSDELKEKYDGILCFDVLEHVWEPKEIVEYLNHHLQIGGILLITAHFEHTEEHPMHLERNVKYLGREFFEIMNQTGFRMERRMGTLLAFRKVKNSG